MTADGKRSGVRIYHAADAPRMAQTTYGSRADFGPHEAALKDVVSALGAASKSTSRLLVNQTKEDGGFSVVYLFFRPHFPLFRHKHEDDCLYVIISGSAVMGNQTLRAGDSFFVPAMAPYMYTAGPDGIEVLEIRHNADPEWGFTTIYTPNPEGRADEARAAIAEHGELWSSIPSGPLMRANAGEA
jgi:hypothetical protein